MGTVCVPAVVLLQIEYAQLTQAQLLCHTQREREILAVSNMPYSQFVDIVF